MNLLLRYAPSAAFCGTMYLLDWMFLPHSFFSLLLEAAQFFARILLFSSPVLDGVRSDAFVVATIS